MLIQGLFDRGSMPALERLLQFAQQRHQVLVDDIANLSTPHHRSRDLDPAAFRRSLQEAIDRRRRTISPQGGPLEPRDTTQLRFRAAGIEARPELARQNLLFHDRNDRDLERTMQYLAENTMAHRLAIDLLGNQFDMLGSAIRGRMSG